MNLDTKKKIQDEVEKTLAILDNVEKIEGNPYLFTRIKANLNMQKRISRFSLAPVLASPRLALIIVLLILNLVSTVLFFFQNNTVVKNNESFVGSLTDEYYLSIDDDILNKLEGKD